MFYNVFRFFFLWLKIIFFVYETSQPNFSRTKGMVGDILSTLMRQVMRRMLFFLLKNLKGIQ
jgi:hypothetical protein